VELRARHGALAAPWAAWPREVHSDDGSGGDLAAARVVSARTPDGTFSPADIVREVRRRGTMYAELTIRTMVTAHLCTDAPDNAGATSVGLGRPSRGVYRLRRP
jgi:hypothetical protein